MKKIKIILIVLLIILSLGTTAIKAKEAQIEVTTSKDKVNIGEEFIISVNTKNLEVAACTIRLYFDKEKVEFISKQEENINVVDGTILCTYFDKQGGKNMELNTNLANFTFKAKQNGLSSFAIQGDFYNKEEKQMKPAINLVEVQVGKQNIVDTQNSVVIEEGKENNSTNLEALRLNQEGISPNFQKDIKEYYITIPEQIENLEVVAVPESKNSKVTITGNENLKNGLNEIVVTVQNSNKQSKYKIYVTKTNNIEEANTNLENLAVENETLEPDFTQQITNYRLSVGNNVENLNVLAVPQNEEAKVKIEGGENLKEGKNNIIITVTAPNNITFKKYQIDVFKKGKQEEEKESTVQKLTTNAVQIDNSKEIEQVEEENKEEETKNSLAIIIGTVIGISILGSILIILIKKRKRQ
ncbi:MAG: hypothetical protein HFJ28_05210 [Clostridia bacterium]|nr:hypothetical protein [Clostridia bacterium]